jgi:hypothetical protein
VPHGLDSRRAPFYLGAHAVAFACPAGGFCCAMPSNAGPRPPSGAIWLHEIKHDGFRVIARKEGKRVVHAGGQAVVGVVESPGGGDRPIQRINPMHDIERLRDIGLRLARI